MQELPMTEMFSRYIRKLAFDFSVPYDDAIQEARLLEWKIQNNRDRLTNIETYFKRSIRNKLIGYYNNYWGKMRVSDEAEDITLETLTTMREFNQIHYDSLLNHLSILIAEIDSIALEVFQIRINEGIKWNEIRKVFPEVSHWRFFTVVNKVQKLTRRVIQEEMSLC